MTTAERSRGAGRHVDCLVGLVEDAASDCARLVRGWGAIDDDDRFELAANVARRLEELRRRLGT